MDTLSEGVVFQNGESLQQFRYCWSSFWNTSKTSPWLANVWFTLLHPSFFQNAGGDRWPYQVPSTIALRCLDWALGPAATTITQEEEEEEEQQPQAEQEEAGVFVKSSSGRVMQYAIRMRYPGELRFLNVGGFSLNVNFTVMEFKGRNAIYYTYDHRIHPYWSFSIWSWQHFTQQKGFAKGAKGGSIFRSLFKK